MIVYLAGPIKAIGRVAAMQRERVLVDALMERDIATFAPAHAWCVPPAHYEGMTPPVQLVDDVAVAVCDVMVVACSIHESLGTDHEIKLALALDKPIIVYSLIPEAIAESWARERGLFDAPIKTNPDDIVALLEEWRRNWKR